MQRIERRRLLAMALFSLPAGWLGCAKAEPRSFANVAEFREFVMGALRGTRGVDSVVPDTRDTAKFKIVMGDWASAGDVTNLFGYLKAYPKENADELVGRFIRATTESRGVVIDEKNIVAVIRAQDYIDYTLSMGLDVLHEPLGGDLTILYMVDGPDSMSTIRSTDLPGKDLASVRKIALDNVRRWLPKVVSNDQLRAGNLYYVDGNTMLSTSLILFDEFWKSISTRFPGDVLIAIPRKDQLFIFDDDGNPAARARVRQLIAGTIKENFNLLSPLLYARRGGKIVVVPD